MTTVQTIHVMPETKHKDLLALKLLIEKQEYQIDSAQSMEGGILYILLKSEDDPEPWARDNLNLDGV